ncbi:MAG: META domain-containing protein [Candidatus Paceibacterota bacterium]
MKKPSLISIIAIVVIVVAVFTVRLSTAPEGLQNGNADPKDATYIIDGKSITLVNGVSEIEITPVSASKMVTRYFGNEVRHDFNGDGREDIAFLLTQNSGGTGTFYYLVVALNTPRGYVGSEGFLLGDRIAPQTTEMGKGNIIVVNYADRKEGESFAVQPSIGKSISILLDPKTMQLGEVVQNFEGEADPAKITLDMKDWSWISTVYKDGKIVVPKDPTRFVLTFKGNNFSAKTDCNGVGGEYIVNGSKISFERMMSTLMYCEGSQENDFSKMMSEVQSYHFTSKGELVFNLKLDGEMVFR